MSKPTLQMFAFLYVWNFFIHNSLSWIFWTTKKIWIILHKSYTTQMHWLMKCNSISSPLKSAFKETPNLPLQTMSNEKSPPISDVTHLPLTRDELAPNCSSRRNISPYLRSLCGSWFGMGWGSSFRFELNRISALAFHWKTPTCTEREREREKQIRSHKNFRKYLCLAWQWWGTRRVISLR